VHVTLPTVPGDAANGHIFGLLARDAEARGKLLAHLNGQPINVVFHHVPRKRSPATLLSRVGMNVVGRLRA
jgi:hypothetical protein